MTSLHSIEPSPTAPLGSVSSLPSYSPLDFPATSAILCRNSAPLIEFAFGLLRRNIPCAILGRDIGAGLKALVDKFSKGTVAELREGLISYQETETQKLNRKGKKAQAEALQDKVSCLLIFARNAVTIEDINKKIDSLFVSAPTQKVTLATIHKSKGLEWPLVFLLDWHLIPSLYAESEWELKQERNLQYVAITRAKLDLRYIKSNSWKQ